MLLDSDYRDLAMQLPPDLLSYLGMSAAKVYSYIRIKVDERNANTVSIPDDEFFKRIGTRTAHVPAARASLVAADLVTIQYENRREDYGITRCRYTLTTKL